MALAVAWRNPNPVHTTKRCIKFGRPSAIYLVQELIAGAEEGQWVTTSVLEILCNGHVAHPPDHASDGSRAAGANSYEPAAS
jgi:hypothetical protein